MLETLIPIRSKSRLFPRTIHQTLTLTRRLLTLYNVELRYVNPPGLQMPDHIVEYVSKRQIPQQQFSTLEEALPDTDVLYMTRIQRERFTSEEEYKQVSPPLPLCGPCKSIESKRTGLIALFLDFSQDASRCS